MVSQAKIITLIGSGDTCIGPLYTSS